MADVCRESKKAFWSRVEREGRREEAEAALKLFIESGTAKRQAQMQLVFRFQPIDGTKTVAWFTPDPWQSGREYWRAPSPSLDEQRDDDIVWAYQNFKSDPNNAPTDSKAFWLKIAQKNPAAFFEEHFVHAHERQQDRRREPERPQFYVNVPRCRRCNTFGLRGDCEQCTKLSGGFGGRIETMNWRSPPLCSRCDRGPNCNACRENDWNAYAEAQRRAGEKPLCIQCYLDRQPRCPVCHRNFKTKERLFAAGLVEEAKRLAEWLERMDNANGLAARPGLQVG
jgi:hypothetical protein